MSNPKVSLIITTKNEAKNIGNCLESITKQTYKNIEILVIDNNSSDKTKEIAKKFTKLVFDKGPERSAQRNFGAEKATGDYVLFLDADMVLTPSVVAECVQVISKNDIGGVIIPEESYGIGFWAQCKALERSFYVGNDAIEAARFYKKEVFKKTGGFDESLTGPEDWDLSLRVKAKYSLGRVSSFIMHNEGNLTLQGTLYKKYYYAKKFSVYLRKDGSKHAVADQVSPLSRFGIFFGRPTKLFANPLLGIGMVGMKFMEYAAGGCGYLKSMIQ